jgi:hypothetical protein
MSPEMQNERRLTVLENDTSRLKEAVDSIAASQSMISESLHKISLLWERYEDSKDNTKRIFDKLEVIEKRMGDIEKLMPIDNNKRLMELEMKMPQLVETRGWVVRAVLAAVVVIGSFVIAKLGLSGK